MDIVAARDFRLRPGTVWRQLRKSHRLVVTSNGKPLALLTDLAGRDLQEELRAEAVARGVRAVSLMRAAARKSGADTMTDREIQRVIDDVRKNS